MRKNIIRLVVSGLALIMLSCGHQAPQRPSRRMGQAPEADSAQLALLELNQQLALAADKQLMQIAQAQEESYALYEGNTWIRFIDRGETETPSPQPNEEWTVHMRVYSLNNDLLMDTERAYLFGHHDLPAAVENNASEWHHGTQARMYVPWYSAFGLQGTQTVAPYQNVIMEIELR